MATIGVSSIEELFADIPAIETPPDDEDYESVYHLYVIRVADRDGIQKKLRDQGVSTGVHYPSIPGFSLYQTLGYRETEFPNAQRIGRETVTLPLFPAMTNGDVKRVCSVLIEVLDTRS